MPDVEYTIKRLIQLETPQFRCWLKNDAINGCMIYDPVARQIVQSDEAIRLDPTYAQAYLNKAVSFAMTERLKEALQWGEKAANLGAPRALEFVHQVRQMLGQAPAQTNSNDPQAAFEAFQRATSLTEMRQTVQQFPVLTQMIPTIEQVIG